MLVRTLFTLPGKIGDNLLRMPVIHRYCAMTEAKVDVMLDEGSQCLISLLKEHPYINEVWCQDGIQNYDLGGQPFDFGKAESWYRAGYDRVYHLGYREFPTGDITEYTHRLLQLPKEAPRECWPGYPISKHPRALLFHVESSRPESDKIAEDAIVSVLPELRALGLPLAIITTRADHASRYHWHADEREKHFVCDHGDLCITAKALAESVFVGTFSSMAALACSIKARQVVIHDLCDTLEHWGGARKDGVLGNAWPNERMLVSPRGIGLVEMVRNVCAC